MVDINNTYEETEFYKDSLFGIAGGFHLVGLDTVDKKAHINGNILANNFINGGDFGTRDLKEVSYLRNISGGGTISAGAHKDSILVVGKNTTIGLEDNGNAWSINGNKVDQPNKINSPDSLWQDGSAEFIDFDEVKQQAKNATDDLAKLEDNATEIKNDDMNDQEIIVTEDSDYNVYNLQDGDFSFANPIHIKGFNKDKASTLIINVDMDKMGNKELFSIPNSVASYTDGSKVSTAEVSEWSNANVVWNIFDSSKSDNIYTGTVENTGAVTGSILAIGATINLKHNLNGTVIGNKIVVTGETHRDDYVPPSKPELETTEISVEKKWIGTEGENITVNLLANGEKIKDVVLSSANNWKHTFTDLPTVNDVTDEEAINYTVEEVEIEGYESSIAGSAALGFVITNTEDTPLTPIEPAKTSVDVEKKWIGTEGENITVNLL
ncbi:MAG: collagen-binding domain-containing protein, partial [Lactococcus lactis]